MLSENLRLHQNICYHWDRVARLCCVLVLSWALDSSRTSWLSGGWVGLFESLIWSAPVIVSQVCRSFSFTWERLRSFSPADKSSGTSSGNPRRFKDKSNRQIRKFFSSSDKIIQNMRKLIQPRDSAEVINQNLSDTLNICQSIYHRIVWYFLNTQFTQSQHRKVTPGRCSSKYQEISSARNNITETWILYWKDCNSWRNQRHSSHSDHWGLIIALAELSKSFLKTDCWFCCSSLPSISLTAARTRGMIERPFHKCQTVAGLVIYIPNKAITV